MEKVGEVVQTATAEFVAESHRLNDAPPFGSLVRAQQGETEQTTIYAVVTSIATSELDPTRRPVARGHHAESLAEIYRQHPQLPELFRTQFTARVLGHARSGAVHHSFPPLPPEVHQLVYACAAEEMVAFTERLTFLPLLLAGPSSEEVTAAFLRHAGLARGTEAQEFHVRAGKQLVGLLRGESVRLHTLLGRLQ